MTIKNPAAAATDPQINKIVELCHEQGQPLPAFAGMTKGEASAKITELLDQAHGKPQVPAKPVSLVAMAAKITGAIVEDEAQPTPAAEEPQVPYASPAAPAAQSATLPITVEQANTLLSWFPVVAA